MPERIQRKRTKGWTMPENTVYVGRPGKYANPFKLVGDMIYCDASHRRKILSPWVLFTEELYPPEAGLEQVVQLYSNWLHGHYHKDGIVRPRSFTNQQLKQELRGKNLCCWCPLHRPCHADILLEAANV